MIRALLDSAIQDRAFPGAAWALGQGERHETGVAGTLTYEGELVTSDTLWDLASLTKVVGTTTVAMRAVEQGQIALDDPISRWIPEYREGEKARVRVAHLLRHDSGLAAWARYGPGTDVKQAVARERLKAAPGTATVYSDLGFITLQIVLERALDAPLDHSVALVLEDSATYFPNPALCAPTEVTKDRGLIQGQVHDPLAFQLGGVAGHAGLFGSLAGLTQFLLRLRKGEIVSRETVEQWTARQSERSSRGLGWDTKSPTGSSAGERFGPRSWGHTGFTGTSVWVDPEADRWAILLTNRVHPTADNPKLLHFRPVFHDAAWKRAGEL